jgi:hypothetical protein
MARREAYYQARIRISISSSLETKMRKEGRIGSLNQYIEEILLSYLTKAGVKGVNEKFVVTPEMEKALKDAAEKEGRLTLLASQGSLSPQSQSEIPPMKTITPEEAERVMRARNRGKGGPSRSSGRQRQ